MCLLWKSTGSESASNSRIRLNGLVLTEPEPCSITLARSSYLSQAELDVSCFSRDKYDHDRRSHSPQIAAKPLSRYIATDYFFSHRPPSTPQAIAIAISSPQLRSLDMALFLSNRHLQHRSSAVQIWHFFYPHGRPLCVRPCVSLSRRPNVLPEDRAGARPCRTGPWAWPCN